MTIKTKPDGSCSFYNSADNKYEIVTKTHQGRSHWVVPVVMMKTGVHCGSNGPILHRIEELGKIVESWNGIPVTIDHPSKDGTSISANSPEVIDSKTVGRIYNAWVDGDKLKAECWLDVINLEERSPMAYKYIKDQWPLDVSVGVFTENEEEEGVWNGEEYAAIATNYRPDHLALLPGSVGACSWADGCGVRTNKERGTGNVTLQELLAQIGSKGFVAYKSGISHESLRQQLASAVSAKISKNSWSCVEEVFDDFFVYQVMEFSEEGPSAESLYRQDYSVTKNGEVELNGFPSAVKRQIEYVAYATMRRKGGNGKMDKKAKVDMLVQSEHSPFVEANRDFLEGLEESQLDELQAKFKEPEKKAPVVNSNPKPAPAPEKKEDPFNVFKEGIKSEEDFLAVLPEGPMKESIRSGIELNKARKTELVEKIVANSKAFTSEELSVKSVEELDKIASLIRPQGNYAALGGHAPVQRNAGAPSDILPPCGVELE